MSNSKSISAAVYDPSELSDDGSYWAIYPAGSSKPFLQACHDTVRKHKYFGQSSQNGDFLGGYFAQDGSDVYFKFVDGGRDARGRPGRTPILFLLTPTSPGGQFNLIQLFNSSQVQQLEQAVVKRLDLSTVKTSFSGAPPSSSLSPVELKQLERTLNEAEFSAVTIDSSALAQLTRISAGQQPQLLQVARQNGKTQIAALELKTGGIAPIVKKPLDPGPSDRHGVGIEPDKPGKGAAKGSGVAPTEKPQSVVELAKKYGMLVAAFCAGMIVFAASSALGSLSSGTPETRVEFAFARPEVRLPAGKISPLTANVAAIGGKLAAPNTVVVSLSEGPAKLTSLQLGEFSGKPQQGGITVTLPPATQLDMKQLQVSLSGGAAAEAEQVQTLQVLSVAQGNVQRTQMRVVTPAKPAPEREPDPQQGGRPVTISVGKILPIDGSSESSAGSAAAKLIVENGGDAPLADMTLWLSGSGVSQLGVAAARRNGQAVKLFREDDAEQDGAVLIPLEELPGKGSVELQIEFKTPAEGEKLPDDLELQVQALFPDGARSASSSEAKPSAEQESEPVSAAMP